MGNKVKLKTIELVDKLESQFEPFCHHFVAVVVADVVVVVVVAVVVVVEIRHCRFFSRIFLTTSRFSEEFLQK